MYVFFSSIYPSPFFRVISRAPGLKLVVETLITSLKPIGNIVLICCAFFIIFGILGVQVGTAVFNYYFFPHCTTFRAGVWFYQFIILRFKLLKEVQSL